MPTELAIHAVNRGGMVVTAGDGRHAVTMDCPAPGAESEELDARGLRRDEHPTVITEIALEFTVHGAAWSLPRSRRRWPSPRSRCVRCGQC